MPVVAASSRADSPRLREIYDIGVICRARHLVATLGGRFSLECGIDVDGDEGEIERWALAATLLGERIPASVVARTYHAFERAGIRTIPDARSRTLEELVALLGEGTYSDYDEETPSRLLTLGEAIFSRHHGRLATLGRELSDPDTLESALDDLPGWEPLTVRAFLRELRGVWPAADPSLDVRATAGARHLHLPPTLAGLRSVSRAVHLDFRDLEAALVRLELSHDIDRCPGGTECPFAHSESAKLVRF